MLGVNCRNLTIRFISFYGLQIQVEHAAGLCFLSSSGLEWWIVSHTQRGEQRVKFTTHIYISYIHIYIYIYIHIYIYVYMYIYIWCPMGQPEIVHHISDWWSIIIQADRPILICYIYMISVQPEISGLQTLNHAGFSPERDFGGSSACGDSSRCTFLKNVVFELLAAQKSKKDVFEKPGQARFFPGPNPVAKGVQPEISILNHAGFSPARDFWETSSWRDSSFDSGFLFQRPNDLK